MTPTFLEPLQGNSFYQNWTLGYRPSTFSAYRPFRFLPEDRDDRRHDRDHRDHHRERGRPAGRLVGKAGEPAADFLIQDTASHGVAGLINLLGIESPGLTSSMAIGDYVAAGIAARLR